MSSLSTTKKGICYLIGAGPGDPGLLTLRGRECLEMADVLVYDYLCNPQLLAWAKSGAEKIYVGKKAGDHTLSQEEINALIVARARDGKIVARLKGGDPLIFGRGGEEAEELRAAGIAFELVPGISSTIAGPAYAGIPVTHRACNTQLTIFTGHEDPTKQDTTVDYGQIARAPGTKVMLMGVSRLREITAELVAQGMPADEPAALIRWATTGRQQTLVATVGTLAEACEKAGLKAPCVCVIGEVVRFHDTINWFEERPLFGKRIVVTRTRKQASELSKLLGDLGADVIELPTIRIDPTPDREEFFHCVHEAHTYDWLIFTSPNAVDAFFDAFFRIYDDARSIGYTRIAVVGPGTEKAVNRYHLAADLMPEEGDYVAEGLTRAFDREGISLDSLKCLWIKGEQTREVIDDYMKEKNAILDLAIAYRTVPETEDPTGGQARFREEGADIITFTSALTVECFLDLGLSIPDDCLIASMGPITSEQIRENGYEVDIEPAQSTIPDFVDAIVEHVTP
jgi:uroporphyrinogen III methyltransferase/synthase